MVDLQAAYAACERQARSHYENFPVASRVLPASMRQHVAAVYAFARAADDFADEGERPPEDRLRLLEGWRRRLLGAAASAAAGDPPAPGEPVETQAIFVALGASIRARQLDVAELEALISAFEQDVTVDRYETWDNLVEYCSRSANPVGRLVLQIAGDRDARHAAWSDAICTALQLTNFWQDAMQDFARGRVYLPADLLRRHGAGPADLAAGVVTSSWRSALADAAGLTRELFERGRPLGDALRGRLRYEVRATWLGGVRILDRLEHSRFDVSGARPALGARDLPWFVWRMITWPSAAKLGGAHF